MGNKKTKNVLLAIMGVLIVVEIVVRILTIDRNTFVGIVHLISLVFTGLYGFWLYKKPHGNILKYAMLLFALANILSGCFFLLKEVKIEIVRVLTSAALCYCSGRLNRINQNKFIMPIIGLAFLVVSGYWAGIRIVNNVATVLGILKSFTFSINYITLMIAYFVRFEEHKEAGLIDAPKK